MSYQILGEALGGSGGSVIVIRLKDPAAIASGQSALASFITKVAPGTKSLISPLVYKAAADKIRQSLATNTPPIDADVSIADGGQFLGKPAESDFTSGAATGGALVALLGGILYVLFWKR